MLDSYHCSRYNTQTRRLTTAMFEGRHRQARADACASPHAPVNERRTTVRREGFVDSLPGRPGVYRMLDAQGEILYVGKARNLKSRVGSYFQPSNVQPKVQALVAKTANMEVTITNSDTEALLLEFNLIKKHRPRFNVVLRDDKSFPYLHFETEHEFPRLTFYRGSRKEPGRFFGPYPSAGAVRETLQQLQKLFRLRNCEDTYFANRSRPCLQYQIQRCTAPCVGLISRERLRARRGCRDQGAGRAQ